MKPTLELQTMIHRRFNRVFERIQQAALKAQRDHKQIRLVVVTKGHPVEVARAAIESGARLLGENYPEEGVLKVRSLHEYRQVEWHMIGHVQSRKARLVSEHFASVHSLDSLKLAQKLDRAAAEFGRHLPVLIECNVSGEESKFGFPAWQEQTWSNLGSLLEPILQFENLVVSGLMTIAPFFAESKQARPYFNRLYRLSQFLSARYPGTNWTQLSMGMSADFEIAIQEGASLVRIGEAILGPRPT